MVDNASTDSTQDLLGELTKKNPAIRSIRNEINLGFAAACNLGARSSSGKYLLFLNNDTKVCPGWFGPLLEVLVSDPSVGIVAPKLIFPDNTIQHCGKVWKDPCEPHSQPHHIYYRMPADLPAANRSRAYRMLTGACILLRREEFLSLGGFDEKFENGWEDDDLCYAYHAAGKNSFYCSRSTVIHYQGKTLREKTALFEKQGSSLLSDPDARARLDDELFATRKRFDRNRSRFFEKWGKEIIRDDVDFYRQDGFENGVVSSDIHPSSRPGASVIIVTYNSAATIIPCLESVQRNCGPCDEIVVVDNASRDETVTKVEHLAASDGRVTLIRNNENRGFTTATNQGIIASSLPHVIMLNPDTVVPAGWIEGLAQHLLEPSVAAVGPISNYVAGLQKEELYRRAAIPPSLTVEDASALFRTWNRGASVETKLLIGFCLMVRRNILDTVGLLDEQLFLGNDDLELSWRLRQKGYRLLVATDTFVYHAGQKSFESEKRSATDALVQESTNRLFEKLENHYGHGQVPPPEELWGISWFRPNARCSSVSEETVSVPDQTGEHDNRLVSIIILTFNQLEHTRRCLESIEKHTSMPFELVFVDNGSSDGTVDWLREQVRQHPQWKLIANDRNLGFSTGCNQGIKASRGNFIMLLNNDVIVTDGWLSGLLECLESSPGTGIVGPMTNNISGIQKVHGAPYDDLSELDSFSVDFRIRNRHRRIPHRRIVGFCMLFRKGLADAIGLLDESFGSGNFEDDDFCLRAEIAGYRNMIAADVLIHHVGSASFAGNNMDFSAAMENNGKLFLEKWSRPVTDRNESCRIVTLKTLEKADMLHQRGEHDKMVECILQEGIRSVPDEERLYHALAEYFLDLARYQDALDTLEEVPLVVSREKHLVLTGRAHLGLDSVDGAVRCAEEALQLNAVHAPALCLLGSAAKERGKHAHAESFWMKAIEADPGYGEPYTCLGMAALDCNPEQALDLLEKGFQLQPLTSEAALMYHQAITDAAMPDRGEKLFLEMRRIHPQNKRIHFLLIDLLVRQGKSADALEEIETACVVYGIDDGMLSAGLELRDSVGPMTIPPGKIDRKTGVSLCMIMKDEEKNLPRCLKSLKPVVDEIVLVDTGSSDRSLAVARLFGARVFQASWTGDFSAARNISLEHACGEWILVMDADEMISPRDYDRFRTITADAGSGRKAYMIETRNYSTRVVMENWQPNDGSYPVEEAGAGWIPSSKIRLFPNRPGIRFEGSIHELVQRTTETAGVPTSTLRVPVHHYGYLDQDRQQRKNDEYYLLGKKKLAEGGGDDFRALCELAIQAGGTERYEEAVELWERVLAINPDYPLAYFNLGFVLMQLGRLRQSRDASAKVMEMQPDHIDAVINYVLCDISLGGAEKAVDMLRKNLRIKPDHFYSRLLLAICQVLIEQREEGLAGLDKIRAEGIEIADFLNDCAKKLIRYENAGYGRKILEATISSGNGNRETVEILKSMSSEQHVA